MYKYSNIRSSEENVGQIRRNCLRNFFWAFPHLYLGPSWIAEFAFSLTLTRRSYFRFLAQNTFYYSTCIMDGSNFFWNPSYQNHAREKCKEKKIFQNMGASCVHLNTFSSEASTQARTLPPYNVQGMSKWGIWGNLIPATKEMVIANAYKYKYKYTT